MSDVLGVNSTALARLFVDEEYHQALMRFLECDSYRVIERVDHPDGRVERTVEFVNAAPGPAFLERLAKPGTRRMVEHGTWHPDTLCYTGESKPVGESSIFRGQRITVHFVPDGPNRTLRKVELSADIHLFGLGSLFERYVRRQVKENFARVSAFAEQWIQEHPYQA